MDIEKQALLLNDIVQIAGKQGIKITRLAVEGELFEYLQSKLVEYEDRSSISPFDLHTPYGRITIERLWHRHCHENT